MINIKRGDIVYVKLLDHPNSCVQSGIRPCLVVSNNKNNQYSNIINVLPLSKKLKNNPVHTTVQPDQVRGYLEHTSDCLAEQVVTVDRRMVIGKTGHIPDDSELMQRINAAICRQLSLNTERSGA